MVSEQLRTAMAAKARAHGEGSPFQRPDGTYGMAVTVRTPDGGSKRVWRYARTRRELATKIAQVRATAAAGDPVPPASAQQTVSQFLDQWLRDVAAVAVSPTTLDSYRSLRNRLVPELGGHKLTALRPAHVQRAYRALLDRGLAASSVRTTHVMLHTALAQAVAWNIIPKNPADGVQLPAARQQPRTVLTAAQVRTLIDSAAAEGDRHAALWVVLTGTALRGGEARALRWEDIDLDGGRLTTRATMARVSGKPLYRKPAKTPASERTVVLPAYVVGALRRHREQQTAESSAHAERWQEQGLVFPNIRGAPLAHTTLRTAWYRALARAGLPRVRPHDGRHGVATMLLRANVHPKVVSEMLGHSSTAITMATYSHVAPVLHAAAAETLDTLIDPSGATAGDASGPP